MSPVRSKFGYNIANKFLVIVCRPPTHKSAEVSYESIVVTTILLRYSYYVSCATTTMSLSRVDNVNLNSFHVVSNLNIILSLYFVDVINFNWELQTGVVAYLLRFCPLS